MIFPPNEIYRLLTHAVHYSPPCRQALDQLGLERYCCRRMVLTHVDLIEKLLHYNRMSFVIISWVDRDHYQAAMTAPPPEEPTTTTKIMTRRMPCRNKPPCDDQYSYVPVSCLWGCISKPRYAKRSRLDASRPSLHFPGSRLARLADATPAVSLRGGEESSDLAPRVYSILFLPLSLSLDKHEFRHLVTTIIQSPNILQPYTATLPTTTAMKSTTIKNQIIDTAALKHGDFMLAAADLNGRCYESLSPC